MEPYSDSIPTVYPTTKMPFTPTQTLIGALLLLQSTSTLQLSTGRPLGASSLLGTLPAAPTLHNTALIAGMLLATHLTRRLAPSWLPDTTPAVPAGTHLFAAALVGAGSRAANGCTSGHLLCGVPRGSRRSLVAAAVFFCAAAATATARGPVAVPDPGAAGMPGVGAMVALLAATAAVSVAVVGLLPACRLARGVAALWCGGVFALGLIVSGMAGAAKPLGFLTVRGGGGGGPAWDPSLAMVLVGAVAPAAGMWRWWVGGRLPALGGESGRGQGRVVDVRLVVGSAVFGVGWGLAGVCPGPAVVAVAGGGRVAGAWVVVFWAGWWGVGAVL